MTIHNKPASGGEPPASRDIDTSPLSLGGGTVEGEDIVNMMTAIEGRQTGAPVHATKPIAVSRRKNYLDENGEPSDRSGPDLTKAVPVDEMMKSLAYRKTGPRGTYSTAFYAAARDSGIEVAATREEDGEHLIMWLPCDGQEDLRNPRYEALLAHLRAKPARRQTVIELLKIIGRFHDNRKFPTVAEAADEFVTAGGRIYVLPDGRCEETMPYETVLSDDWRLGYPIKQLSSRYDATLRRKGAREELASLVRVRGKLDEGSGAYVLEADRN